MPYKAVVLALEFLERESEMASTNGTSRGRPIPIEDAIGMIQDLESHTGGLLSDKESDLDQQLYNMDENRSYAASGDNDDGADIQSVVLPLHATPAPLPTAAFAAPPAASATPPAAPLVAEVSAVLTAATPAATPARFYGRVHPPARLVRRVHVVDQPANSGAGHSRPCCWF
ncbi:unnamed protein product [Porites lobata]|uniref:Uncharacterized protein n=1 Tax=Porites lobata TaxID=104759 RepID=A0ABN8PZZ1_9CNID|nr:unnamed protein product [Porites lobata]